MPLVNYQDFPDDEREDFEQVCNKIGTDPDSFTITAQEERFPIGNGIYHIDRMVKVVRDGVSVDLYGDQWVAEFEQKYGLFIEPLRHQDK